MTLRLAAILAVSAPALFAGLPAWAQAPDFGSDTSVWANDGECDDPRFTGPGVAAVTDQADLMADATDCRAAFEAGTATLAEGQGAAGTTPSTTPSKTPTGTTTPATTTGADGIDYGADTSQWANDGECDDPRFTGPGVAPTASDVDVMADATDCRAAVAAGTASLAEGQGTAAPVTGTTPATGTVTAGGINFGDDSGSYPNDGECDDRRFTGPGMAVVLSWFEVGRDATDCQALYDGGQIRLWNLVEAQAATQCASLDFGNDTSPYANDGQCDDVRFEGPGTAFQMDQSGVQTDAADCARLCALGVAVLRDY